MKATLIDAKQYNHILLNPITNSLVTKPKSSIKEIEEALISISNQLQENINPNIIEEGKGCMIWNI